MVSNQSVRWRVARPTMLMGVVIAFAIACVNVFGWDYVAGDPLTYHDRMESILRARRIPYFEAEFEHLPAVLAPMAAVWYSGGLAGPRVYRAVWAVATALVLVVSAKAMESLGGPTQSEGLGSRWVVVAAPLVPIALFRTEPWIVLTVILGTKALIEFRAVSAGGWTFLGIVGKGWPAVIAVGGLLRRRLVWPMIAVLAALVVLIPVFGSNGFTSGRSFAGLHAESVGGAGAALWSLATTGGVPLLEEAGAAYVDTSQWWLLAGLLLGAIVVVTLLISLHHPLGARQTMAALGSLVGAGLLASPLQSTQFLFWITPFVASSSRRSTRFIGMVVGGIGLVNLVAFESMVNRQAWWFASVLLRNLLLAGVAFRLAMEVRRENGGATASGRQR